VDHNGVLGPQPSTYALTVEAFSGPRSELALLFAEADDSAAQIAEYRDLGEVIVARWDGQIAGHVQLINGGREWEIKSLAVFEQYRGIGVGSALGRAALERAFSAGATRVLVSTASADIANLRFYQRLGFRMDRVERDAFRAERGYACTEVDGIPVRDQVWFSLSQPEFILCLSQGAES
jgi:ribosomal protein S18 acetylase RimI-like enzyme